MGSWLGDLFRFGGLQTVTVSDTASATSLTEDQAQGRVLVLVGTLTNDRGLRLPNKQGADWIVIDRTSGGFSTELSVAGLADTVSMSGDQQHVFVGPEGVESIVGSGTGITDWTAVIADIHGSGTEQVVAYSPSHSVLMITTGTSLTSDRNFFYTASVGARVNCCCQVAGPHRVYIHTAYNGGAGDLQPLLLPTASNVVQSLVCVDYDDGDGPQWVATS